MSFKPAARRNAKLRLALDGPAGSGKTYTALQIAKLLSDRVALMDSERGSAEKYAIKGGTVEGPGNWNFDHCNLEEKTTAEYVRVIGEAAAAGYPVLVIDSYSHSWVTTLEAVDKGGGWTRVGKVVSPAVQKLVDAILSYPGHVIATMRSKVEHAIEKDANGKVTVRKLGMAPVARDGTDYEFDVVLDLEKDTGALKVSKSRCSALALEAMFGREQVPTIARTLRDWLAEGVPLTPRETAAEAIHFAPDVAALTALIPTIGALPEEDRKALAPLYKARKAELQASTGD